VPRRPPDPPRHARPDIDEAALEAARAVDRLLVAARERGAARWVAYLGPLPDRLRDDGLADLRGAARIARSAYGPKDSIRDVLPAELTEPLLEAIDRLTRLLAKREVEAG
jgi:hypothetical protein